MDTEKKQNKMSKKTVNNQEDQEIDLGQILHGVNRFIQNIKKAIFNCIQFFIRNRAIVATLLVLGVGIGIYLDKTTKTYNQEVIVSPYLGTTDHLYSKIEYLSSKLIENDTTFFASIGVKKVSKIGSIKIEPILDIYEFVNSSRSVENEENTQNFELVKLLAEEGSLKEVIKDKLTSKNYPNHKIQIITSGKINPEDLIYPILKFINTDKHYNKILEITRENILIKMKKNEQEIVQVDSILNFMAYNLRQSKNSNLIYNNENNQINPLFELKNELITEIANQKINLENLTVFIKETSITTNITNTKSINGKLKFILPLLFIFGFILIRFSIDFYKSQKKLIAEE